MALWNALELLMNSRGIGWNWSQEIPVSRSSKEMYSRPRFLLYSAIRLLFYVLAFDAIAETIRAFSADFVTPTNALIIDPSLPPISRNLRYAWIAYLNLWFIYFLLQWVYQFLAITSIIFLLHDPLQWPPLFNDPWLSTSLGDFWGRRWHQLLRYPLKWAGGVPCAYLFGRGGGILGAFLFSGILHDIEIRCYGHPSSFLGATRFFGMQGIGILMERGWLKASGRRVSGIYGWIWTFTWLLLWGMSWANSSLNAGRFTTDTVPGDLRPTMFLISSVFPVGTNQSIVLNCLALGTSLSFVAYSLLTSGL